MKKITAEKFRQCVGCDPEQDDLERCNCPLAGNDGHFDCGWDYEQDLPVFLIPLGRRSQKGDKP